MQRICHQRHPAVVVQLLAAPAWVRPLTPMSVKGSKKRLRSNCDDGTPPPSSSAEPERPLPPVADEKKKKRRRKKGRRDTPSNTSAPSPGVPATPSSPLPPAVPLPEVPPGSFTVFVGGLPYDVSKEQLTAFFQRDGCHVWGVRISNIKEGRYAQQQRGSVAGEGGPTRLSGRFACVHLSQWAVLCCAAKFRACGTGEREAGGADTASERRAVARRRAADHRAVGEAKAPVSSWMSAALLRWHEGGIDRNLLPQFRGCLRAWRSRTRLAHRQEMSGRASELGPLGHAQRANDGQRGAVSAVHSCASASSRYR